MRAVPVTHQFLAKPCEPEVIEHVICRAVELNELLVAPELRELVGEVKKMPSLPGVYSELTAVMADPDCSLGAVTDVVVKDPAMCAKLLQLVNSAFFSRGAEIADVRAAVMRLGIELVKNLALAAEVFSATTLPRSLRKRFSLEALQQHALSSAVVARGLVPDRGDGTDAFTACMLQDVGQLILAEQLPERFDEALSLAETEGVDAYAAEKRVFGASHAELGAYLLGTWGLPYPIVEAVANHHDPGRASTACFGVAEATHVAGVLVSGVDVRPDYLSAWGVDDQYAAWKDRARKLLEKAGG